MAYRAGAVLRDLEFVQFHPTTLYVAGASRALITETLRGEGAILLDNKGRRFMKEYHEAGELAPRDVVSRAILAQMRKTESDPRLPGRAPSRQGVLRQAVPADQRPVRELRHRRQPRPDPGAAQRPLHDRRRQDRRLGPDEHRGPVRLRRGGLDRPARRQPAGSNSLLEGLVFGKIAGQAVAQAQAGDVSSLKHPVIQYEIPQSDRSRLDTADVRNSLRSLMWRNVGITRRAKPLARGRGDHPVLAALRDGQGLRRPGRLGVPEHADRRHADRPGGLDRKESRGMHFRTDFPQTDDAHFKRHIEMARLAGAAN